MTADEVMLRKKEPKPSDRPPDYVKELVVDKGKSPFQIYDEMKVKPYVSFKEVKGRHGHRDHAVEVGIKISF